MRLTVSKAALADLNLNKCLSRDTSSRSKYSPKISAWQGKEARFGSGGSCSRLHHRKQQDDLSQNQSHPT